MSRKRPFLTNRRNQVLSFPPFEHRQGQFRDFGWRSALALHYDYNRASKRDEGAPRGRAAIYGCVGNAPRAVIPTAAGIIRIANDSRGERVGLAEHCAQVRGAQASKITKPGAALFPDAACQHEPGPAPVKSMACSQDNTV